jgi:hypothetical protein
MLIILFLKLNLICNPPKIKNIKEYNFFQPKNKHLLKDLLEFVAVEVWQPDGSVPVRGCGASACPRQNRHETEKINYKFF